MDLSIVKTIKEKNIEFVRLEVEDINGISRGVLLDVDHFLENMHQGFSFPLGMLGCIDFDGKGVDNDILGEGTDFGNGVLYPDFDTFALIPWKRDVAAVICDMSTTFGKETGLMSSCHTRSICKRQMQNLEDFGYQIKSSVEYEFYVVDEKTKQPIYQDSNINSTLFNERTSEIVCGIMSNLKKFGVRPEKFHVECASAMHEITMKPSFGIKGPDDAMRYKSVVKETCILNDVYALFTTTPYKSDYRSSGQLNFSLWHFKNQTNAFHDTNHPNELSKMGKSWLAGLQAHSKSLMCLALPTYNCYECFRIQEEGTYTGPMLSINNAWGYDNRTVGYRVKMESPEASYIEYRVPGSAMNPYIVSAAVIAAGLDGIRQNMELQEPPYRGNVTNEGKNSSYFDIPTSLGDALECLQQDPLFVKELGKDFIDAFVNLKNNEIQKVEKLKSNENNLWQFYLDYYMLL